MILKLTVKKQKQLIQRTKLFTRAAPEILHTLMYLHSYNGVDFTAKSMFRKKIVRLYLLCIVKKEINQKQ